MTKPTQDKETLREAVSLSTRTAFVASLMNANNEMGYLDFDSMEEMINRAWNYFVQGGPDAAIATMFERLRDLPPSIYDGPDQYLRKADVLAAFQQENSDGR